MKLKLETLACIAFVLVMGFFFGTQVGKSARAKCETTSLTMTVAFDSTSYLIDEATICTDGSIEMKGGEAR